MPTASSKFTSFDLHQPLFIAAIIFNFFVVYASSDLSIPQELGGGRGRGVGLRSLKSFKEKKTGTNITFDCSPSGPCVPCQYSEKKDDTYRCSETGYRIPMKCRNLETQVDEENDKKRQKGRSTLENADKLKLHVLVHNAEDPTTLIRQRNLLEESSSREDGSGIYITYRSCIPAINEEKLSVLGFEAIILLLLASSLFVIFRRKGTLVMPGAVRVPTNSRF
ncbi:uncharacterized protein LOC112525817 [Cynara cardunculus var. scolymus]|uniref:Uncharacterized protein n=1 Tax=Cynara cardunculus var. scolymus TaxID=59895 RepID=A0A118K392_CYNCS|nr:uncharacterized protein LOC112525817 [Cynara cardunculus var. scolymus]KVI05568.1 hypothetical protein Ccrd_016070 [Cynara cardunculus var. scolymus]